MFPSIINVSMSSREIAELTGKQHSHVCRDIRTMLAAIYDDPCLDHQEIQGVTAEYDHRKYVVQYHLNKDLTLTLLTGYDTKARLKVIQRWQELEAANTVVMPNFSDPVAAARAWADAKEKQLEAEAKMLAAERDNALLNTIIDNEFGYSSILRAAQHLGVHETEFNWRILKRGTLEAGLEIKRVPSPRYEYQNLYPISVFARCYPNYDFSGLQPEAVAQRSIKLLGGQVMRTAH